MGRKLSYVFLAAFLVYCLFILQQYFANCCQVFPSVWWYGWFAFSVIGAKFFFVFILAAAAYGAGGLFSRWLPEFGSLLEEGLFRVAAGLFVIEYATFALGLAGLLYPLAGVALLAVCLAVGARDLYGFFARVNKTPRMLHLDLAGVMLFAVTLFVLVKGMSIALRPPMSSDILMYHYGVPRMYIDAHRIFPTPDINGSSYPFGTEMLYMLAMLVEGEISANLVTYFMGIGCGLVAYDFTRRFVKSGMPFLSMAVFLCIPQVVWLLFQSYVEFSQGFFICLSLYALIASLEDKSGRFLYLSAAMIGMAMCTKYTSNLVLFIMLAGVAWRAYFMERTGAKKAARDVFRYSGLALLIVLPWYIKNKLFYGNPFYPMLVSGAGQSAMDEFAGMDKGMLGLLKVPWDVTMHPGGYWVGGLDSLGPSLLMLLPGILLFRRVEREIKYLMVFCLLYIVAWYLSAQNIRYLVPAAPFLAVLAAYPVGRLLKDEGRLRRGAGLALAGVFSFTAVFVNIDPQALYGFPSLNEETRDAYYTELGIKKGYIASYEAWKWINSNLPEDAVIFQIFDDPSVYFRRRKTVGFTMGVGSTGRDKIIYLRGFNSFGGYRPGEEIISNLRAVGASYLLINSNRDAHCVPEDPYFASHSRLIYGDNGIFLFQILY